MLRRYLGLQDNSVKRKKTGEERKEQQKVYDSTKRKRTFQPKWNTEFKWALFDGDKLYCHVCHTVYGPLARDKRRKTFSNVPDRFTKYASGQFITGSANLKHDTLRDHNTSLGHREAESVGSKESCTRHH